MMKTVIFLLILFATARGGVETLYCGPVSTPDEWTNFGGASKTESVTDTIDNNYIDEITEGQIQRFTLKDPATIGGTDRIDSIVVRSRMMTPSGTGVTARVNHIVSSTAYGTGRALSGSWTDYNDVYATDPGGNDWTLGAVKSLEIEVEAVSIPLLKRARCTRMFVEVYFTSIQAAPRRRIYRQLMLMGE